MRFYFPLRDRTQDRKQRRADPRCGPGPQSGLPGSDTRGFTLLELIIVVGIIVILATLSAGRYEKSLVRAHEAALSQDLSEMRKAIQNYTLDKQASPNSLDDLVQANYLSQIPVDPVTHQRYWNTDTCDMVMDPDQKLSGGICNVHSTSDDVSPFENTAYSSW